LRCTELEMGHPFFLLEWSLPFFFIWVSLILLSYVERGERNFRRLERMENVTPYFYSPFFFLSWLCLSLSLFGAGGLMEKITMIEVCCSFSPFSFPFSLEFFFPSPFPRSPTLIQHARWKELDAPSPSLPFFFFFPAEVFSSSPGKPCHVF